ncbi:MAG: DegV family protein [Sideroxyarcus sp.]|nr:DegV family protein [Sideroxyarcus sp.]
MKIGLVVDSSCDLPHSFFKNGDVELMPTVITVGDQSFDDLKDDKQTLQFHADTFERMEEKSDIPVTSRPYTSDKIETLFLEKLVCKYDHVFCIMASHARSEIYDHAMQASRGILTKYKPIRRSAGLDSHFTLAVINSANVFAGTGVIAAEVARMIKTDATPSDINSRIREVVPHTYCYLVPPDLEHVYKRASQRGDKSISWLGFRLGSMLDIKPILLGHNDETKPVAKMRGFESAVETMFTNATRAVEQGLMSTEICVAFGGDPARLLQFPGFNRFREAVTKARYTIHISPMSISGSVHAGPGCVEVAFISDKHVFEEKV